MQIPDFEKLNNLFNELEFKNLLGRVQKLYSANENYDENTEIEEASEITRFQSNKVKYHLVKSVEGA
jgi:hypothetical protein